MEIVEHEMLPVLRYLGLNPYYNGRYSWRLMAPKPYLVRKLS